MGVAALWYARIPADSTPWKASLADPASLIPPPSVFVDILPYAIIFGLGLACVVAPLTNALMACVPGRYSGLGSAINNSISRVGQPLLGAIIFIALSATYYATLGNLAPGLDTESTGVRSVFQPLNPAAGCRHAGAGRGRHPGVDRCLPPGDDRQCRPALHGCGDGVVWVAAGWLCPRRGARRGSA